MINSDYLTFLDANNRGTLVSNAAPLPVVLSNPVTSLSINNTSANAVPVSLTSVPAHPVSLLGLDGATAVSNTNAIPVTVVGGSTGGSSSSLTVNGASNVTASNPMPVLFSGTNAWVEATTCASGATLNGLARANPGGGMIFVARVVNTVAVQLSLLIDGSLDGTTWVLNLKNVSVPANSTAVVGIDATTYPYYRARFNNSSGGAQGATFQFITYYTQSSVDIVSSASITNNITLSSGSNTIGNVNIVQNGTAVSNSSPLAVQATNSMGGQGTLTTTVLGANATYTSTAVTGSSSVYTGICLFVSSDQSGTAWLEFSYNNSTWYRGTQNFSVTATTPVIVSTPVPTTYFRVQYVNGATAQTQFIVLYNFSRVGAV